MCRAYTSHMLFSSWGPLRYLRISGDEVHEKVSLWISVSKKTQLHQIILAFYLIAIKFSSILTMDFFEINPMLDKGLMRVNLGTVPGYGEMSVRNGLHWPKVGPNGGPTEMDACTVARRRTFLLKCLHTWIIFYFLFFVFALLVHFIIYFKF